LLKEAKRRHIPIRIGVNAGFIGKRHTRKRYGGHPTPAGMVESGLQHIAILFVEKTRI